MRPARAAALEILAPQRACDGEGIREHRALSVGICDHDVPQSGRQAIQREASRFKGPGLQNAIVRVRLKLRPDQLAGLREDELRRTLNEYDIYHLAGVERKVDRPRRVRLGGASVEGLSPLQLLEKYLETKNVRPDRVELLLKHAHTLIHGAVPESPAPEAPSKVESTLIPVE